MEEIDDNSNPLDSSIILFIFLIVFSDSKLKLF